MTRGLRVLVAVGCVCPALAHAAEPAPPSASTTAELGAPARFDERSFFVGLGTGWGVPLGRAESGLPLGDLVVGQAPVAVDLGFRALPHVLVGAALGWGFGAPEDCPSAARCRVTDLRFGLDGRYLFTTATGLVPWIGLGAGYEVLTARSELDGVTAKSVRQGVTLVDLGLGLDVPIRPGLAVGPTVKLGAGEFSAATVEGTDADVEGEIEAPRLHGWALFGARLVIAP